MAGIVCGLAVRCQLWRSTGTQLRGVVVVIICNKREFRDIRPLSTPRALAREESRNGV